MEGDSQSLRQAGRQAFDVKVGRDWRREAVMKTGAQVRLGQSNWRSRCREGEMA